MWSVVAIKVFKAGMSEQMMRKFKLEAKTLRALRHPNICYFFDTGLLNGAPVLVLELLNGGTLGHHLCIQGGNIMGEETSEYTGASSVSQDGQVLSGPTSESRQIAGRPHGWFAISSGELLQLATDVASGLHYLHTNGVTHRDVKNANVMVDRGHAQMVRAKLCDFGISFLKNTSADDHHLEQRSFSSIGTTRYQAPEMTQLQMLANTRLVPSNKLEVVHHACVDVYSYGLILYEIMHGRIFYGELSPVVVAMKTCEGHERPPVDLRPEHEQFADLIVACWDAVPERRPTMEQVVEALSTGEKFSSSDGSGGGGSSGDSSKCEGSIADLVTEGREGRP